MTHSSRGELEQTLEKAQAELDSLREQRSQQVKMTESIVKQRDMYRMLLAQATGVSFPQQGNSVPTPAFHAAGKIAFFQSWTWCCLVEHSSVCLFFVFYPKVRRLRSSPSPRLPDVHPLPCPPLERRRHSSPWSQIQLKHWRLKQL